MSTETDKLAIQTADVVIEQARKVKELIETSSDPDAQAKLAEAFEMFGMCDAAHVSPGGIYFEE